MPTKDFSLHAAGTNCPTSNIDELAYANEITNKFEGGKSDSLQTADSGIVSYGRHQATLSSGTLEKVLTEYVAASDSSTAENLGTFLPRVQAREESLRTDKTFLSLLTDAAREEAMSNAQDKVFAENFWGPAKRLAEKIGICSPLGKAILYDTNIQGGLHRVLQKTIDDMPSENQTESLFLKTFLKKRREYLEYVAERKLQSGDETTAKLLKNSAAYRIDALERQLEKQLEK